jgi:glucuronate isomerase
MTPFLSENFLLQTKTAQDLYHNFAKDMPIFDYHCHLPVQDIADNRNFANLTQIRLSGDHYKWRAMRSLGADSGFDTIGDFEIAGPLAKFLDTLDRQNMLAKTILYVLNPRDNESMAAMIGNFQDAAIPGKIQFGSAWRFNDQKDGLQRQINALSNMGLLSRFVGMLTDSRSFLSYPRHEYFRRVLCNLLGNDVESGEMPGDLKLIGGMLKDICFDNAANYFGIVAP